MADKKSIAQTLNEFSRKITAMSNGAEFRVNAESNRMKNLQAQINLQEEERLNYLKARFSEYLEPITQNIEEDEEALMKAYSLFCQFNELNQNAGDRTTRLKSLSLMSPLCRKTEYTSELPSENFSLLRLWFIVKNPEALLVPEISEVETAPGTYVLDFIDIDMWQQNSFEKEIIMMT